MFSLVFSLQKNECFLYFESSSSLYRFKYRSYRIYYQIHAIKHDHKASEKSTKMITDNAFISIPDESRKRNIHGGYEEQMKIKGRASVDCHRRHDDNCSLSIQKITFTLLKITFVLSRFSICQRFYIRSRNFSTRSRYKLSRGAAREHPSIKIQLWMQSVDSCFADLRRRGPSSDATIDLAVSMERSGVDDTLIVIPVGKLSRRIASARYVDRHIHWFTKMLQHLSQKSFTSITCV